jgi:hypothetical protein
MTRALWASLAILAAIALALWAPPALALDRTFAGSVQVDEHIAPFQPSDSYGTQFFGGFTTELSGKIAADISEHVSANVKVCYGCHGFETDMAYVDLRVVDELNFRVGRFSPSFGAFNLRHDPANHKLADKPLPYDMGRMLRLRDWNMGVLPSPFPDNGVEIDGSHWFGDVMELDWAVYAVSGFKSAESSLDIDFVQSREGNLYYVDNNDTPAGGGRLAATFRLSPATDLTFGGSGMYGTFDPQNRFSYAILGADVWLRAGRTNVRAEWLVRRQEFSDDQPTQLKYTAPPGQNFFVKHGAYVEVETPMATGVDAIARVDGLWRVGDVAATSPLTNETYVLRYTIGASIVVAQGVRLKLTPELWQFDYADASGRKLEASMHIAVAAAF